MHFRRGATLLTAATLLAGAARAEPDPHGSGGHAAPAAHAPPVHAPAAHAPPPAHAPARSPEPEHAPEHLDDDASPPPPSGPPVVRIPAPGGEVVLTGERDQRTWDEFHYAPLRRAGDQVFLSGVIIGPRAGEGKDPAAFKAQARRAFLYLQSALGSVGLTFADVAALRSYHVWSGPNFTGDKAAQIEAFLQVKDEFFKAPYPAWTSVGVSELLSAAGVVEVELVAQLPPAVAPPKPAAKPATRRPAPRRAPAPAEHGEAASHDAGH